MLDGLVQHQSQEPGSVGHGRPQVALLLKELVQLVPLTGRRVEGRLHSAPFCCAGFKVSVRYHSDPLQVHLCPPQLLPAVVFVALPLGDATELARGLKDVFDQRTTAHLVGCDLAGRQAVSVCDTAAGPPLATLARPPLGLWSARDTAPAAACSRSYSEGCRRHRTSASLCSRQGDDVTQMHSWAAQASQHCSYPSIRVGYMDPNDVWLSYCGAHKMLTLDDTLEVPDWGTSSGS